MTNPGIGSYYHDVICDIYDEIEKDDPNISTPQLFARTIDLLHMRHSIICDDSDIAGALSIRENLRNGRKDSRAKLRPHNPSEAVHTISQEQLDTLIEFIEFFEGTMSKMNMADSTLDTQAYANWNKAAIVIDTLRRIKT